jgi:hypothetical protein
MKYLFVIGLLSTILSCNPSKTPEQHVVYKTDTLSKVVSTNALSELKCDSKANLIEKFEQNGALFERFSFTKGSDMQPKWLKITEAASKLEHDAWAKEAKSIVENYWRKNINLFKSFIIHHYPY